MGGVLGSFFSYFAKSEWLYACFTRCGSSKYISTGFHFKILLSSAGESNPVRLS